jgi:hypothetical protein
MGGSGNGSAASEARSGRRGEQWRGGEREGADDGRRESKKKTYFCKYANACAGWPAGPSGLAVWAGEVAGRLGRK